jgi:hypothetical protein
VSVAAATTALLASSAASADVTLLEKDGWTVFTNGRVQTFFNYNNGDGYPSAYTDGQGNQPQIVPGGGVERGSAYVELEPDADPNDPGKVEELRIRTGFVGDGDMEQTRFIPRVAGTSG